MQIVSNFLDTEECETLKHCIDFDETKHVTSYDNRLELEWKSDEWAKKLWKRWQPLHALPPQVMDELGGVWEPFAFDSTLTLIRQDTGYDRKGVESRLAWPEWRVRSFSTTLIHLNEIEQGGVTVFPDQYMTMEPKSGLAITFVNDAVVYETKTIEKGRKYLLSIPILYRLVKYEKGLERVELFQLYQKASKENQEEDWKAFMTYMTTLVP